MTEQNNNDTTTKTNTSMDDCALSNKICVSEPEHLNSIVQHHFREVLLGNCTEGGIFLSTKCRTKLKSTQLQKVFVDGKIAHIAVLHAKGNGDNSDGNFNEGSTKNGTGDSGGCNGNEEGVENIRFFSFNDGWEKVFFKTSTEIQGESDGEILLQAVFAYCKSVDLYFKTSLYDRIFNAGDRLRRESLQETEATSSKQKLRYKSEHGAVSFGKYMLKPRPEGELLNLLPVDAMLPFDVGMNLSIPDKEFIEADGYKAVQALETVSKVPVKKKGKRFNQNLVYDPHEKCDDVGELLCLKVGMEVRLVCVVSVKFAYEMSILTILDSVFFTAKKGRACGLLWQD